MKPWWQVAIPHKDIREGQFDPSVFAVDLGEVVYGQGVQEYLGIKLITSRIKHPQTNGKIEKLFDCYNRYRDDFDSLNDFVYWYNNVRFHEGLDTKHYLQTPEDAFWSRLPVEARLGVAFKLFDEVVGNER